MKNFLFKFIGTVLKIFKRTPRNVLQVIFKSLVSQNNSDEDLKNSIKKFIFLNNFPFYTNYLKNHYGFKYIENSEYKGLHNIKEKQKNEGDFSKIDRNKYRHALQMINDPIIMNDFSLDEVETIKSEYEIQDLNDIPDSIGFRKMGKVPKRRFIYFKD